MRRPQSEIKHAASGFEPRPAASTLNTNFFLVFWCPQASFLAAVSRTSLRLYNSLSSYFSKSLPLIFHFLILPISHFFWENICSWFLAFCYTNTELMANTRTTVSCRFSSYLRTVRLPFAGATLPMLLTSYSLMSHILYLGRIICLSFQTQRWILNHDGWAEWVCVVYGGRESWVVLVRVFY